MKLKSKFSFIFDCGFKPFFLAGSLFSVLSMGYWLIVYSTNYHSFNSQYLTPMQWHAHSMVYGYSTAIIAGFLLTAVQNWTGLPTLSGVPLFFLFLSWLSARVLWLVPEFNNFLLAAGILDMGFYGGLVYSVVRPIIKAKQWRQLSIVAKLLSLFIGNCLFYYGIFNNDQLLIQKALYIGLYLIVALILLIGARVIPFFIERASQRAIKVSGSMRLNIFCFLLFSSFIVIDIFTSLVWLATFFAVILFVLYSIKLINWHTPIIWKQPLLWVLYVSYSIIVIGFALKAAVPYFNISPLLSVHSFAIGGIGLMTIGMMARVSLGHTGRNIYKPQRVVKWIFFILLASAVLRVFFPMVSMQYYQQWILVAQICWILAYALFIKEYFSILTKPKNTDSNLVFNN